ncbi:amylo-alpha-1,6-glucosidase [Silvibacterium acidisoli]|uniref:amylo-alpha-1,6-glucosidase n=1 Tax=Acidobacteriaceae bacterium ZG23-2 TaxID=2883246 RepID=UPI00406C1FB5
MLLLLPLPFLTLHAEAQTPGEDLTLSRPVRPWELMPVLGHRAGLLGKEDGHFEAWAYPLKILRNFHLNFRVDGQLLAGDTLVRSIVVTPASTTLIYAYDTFQVKETLTVPVDQPAAIITIEVNAAQPVEVEAAFEREMKLEWPALMGGSSCEWNPRLHAFVLTEDEGKLQAIVGSPTASLTHSEYQSNFSSSNENAFSLGSVVKGTGTKVIAIAAHVNDPLPADRLYQQVLTDHDRLVAESAAYYHAYLDHNVQLDLPDHALEQAYKWSQVSMIQGLVDNPYLGSSLIAGYNISGDDLRPGFAWFFGRDALWTSFALNATGDFATSKKALEFLSKYQRADGKVPHEIAQGASFVPWFDKLPYAYSSADATPLLIIAMRDYVLHSGDVAFAEEHWDNLWRAYQFMVSTYDAQGLAQNINIGHGWVEGGPLRPMKGELYQSALAFEAIRSLATIAGLLHKSDLRDQLTATFAEKQKLLNRAFWIEDKHRYAFALDTLDHQVDVPTVLSTVPMWFDLLDHDKADLMIGEIAKPEHQADWGMRILSAKNPIYDPGGYHYGTVWPLFTGWASVGEYRYHHPLQAFSNLRTNALLTFDGSLGHVTEVLSGDYNQTLATGTPDQIWSAAMVASPLVLGMLGLETNVPEHRVTFAPQVPADWTHFAVRHIALGDTTVDLSYAKTTADIEVKAHRSGSVDCRLDLAPLLSPRAKVRAVLLDGHKVPFHLESVDNGQILHVAVSLRGDDETITIQMRDDFGISVPASLPLIGQQSQGLRVLSEEWSLSHDKYHIHLAGTPGKEYDLGAWNIAQINSIDGGHIVEQADAKGKIAVSVAVNGEADIVIHFK